MPSELIPIFHAKIQFPTYLKNRFSEKLKTHYSIGQEPHQGTVEQILPQLPYRSDAYLALCLCEQRVGTPQPDTTMDASDTQQ